jgi:hypothetical protein
MTIITVLVLFALSASIDIAGAWVRSLSDSSEYLDPGYTVNVTEIDVPALGAAIDSIHTMMIIENSSGFDSSDTPFAVLLFRDELVRVEILTDESVITRYGLELENPYRMICDPLGETALVIGDPRPDLITQADLIDFESGSTCRFYLTAQRQNLPAIHLYGGTLLVLYEDSAVCFDRRGNNYFSSTLLNNNSTVRIIDEGESILTTGERQGRGSTLIKLNLIPDTVWILDTGCRNASLVSPDQDWIGYFSAQYRSNLSEFVNELFSFDLQTGEILSHEEFLDGLPTEYTSRNGLYWCRIQKKDDQLESIYDISYSTGVTVSGERSLFHEGQMKNNSYFNGIAVIDISNSGRILLRQSHGYNFVQYILADYTGEVIWSSELICGTDFPSYMGLFTDWKYRPAQLNLAGNQVIYSDRHTIRILTFNEER